MRATVKSPSQQASAPGPGRPRDGAFDARILDATLALLAEVGYQSMSLDDVAAKAGVSKPAIYRRWSSKAQLATAALARLQAASAPERSGAPRDDLVTLLASFRRLLLRPNGLALIGTLLAEEHSNPELIALFRERIVATRRAQVRALLEDAAARGELRRGADLDAATNALIGSFYARYLSGERIGPDWPERVVALVWSGLAR
jgi:AcrR family transcriptional regulator